MEIKRINLWSSPRNVSTAMMYSFAQREDTTVVDEPLYAHYLSKTESIVHHPGRSEVLHHQEQDGEKVVRNVILGSYPTPVVVFKQMTHHLIHLDLGFLSRTENVLLIRNPREIIESYCKVIPNPGIHDIGIAQQYDLFNYLQSIGKLAAVVDTRELLLDPGVVLRKLCAHLGIPFTAKMLKWKPGPRPEDGIWARYWYDSVHRSTGFLPYQEREFSLSPDMEVLAKECQPYYEYLFQYAIKHNDH